MMTLEHVGGFLFGLGLSLMFFLWRSRARTRGQVDAATDWCLFVNTGRIIDGRPSYAVVDRESGGALGELVFSPASFRYGFVGFDFMLTLTAGHLEAIQRMLQELAALEAREGGRP